MTVPRAEKGLVCPFHGKDVSRVCHTCPLWVQVRGMHPQTGEPVDEWKCSLAWLPLLAIEQARQTSQAGAAVESFRNEMVRANEDARQMLGAQLLRLTQKD